MSLDRGEFGMSRSGVRGQDCALERLDGTLMCLCDFHTKALVLMFLRNLA